MGSLSEDRRARVILSSVAEPGDRRIGRLLAEHGAVATVELLSSANFDPALHARCAARLASADPEADLGRVDAVGGRFVIPGDLEWPSQLGDLGDAAPWALWIRGAADLRMSALRSVAVVGARAATSYGTHVASSIAADLALSGWAVVSGGAFGIDAAAHHGALAAGGVTVAVLACGVDVAYPPRHDSLFERIAADGVLVSEVPPGAVPHRTRFLIRNRLIAALTRGIVVVEAALRSGALATAHDAARLNRPVLGVPGPVTSAMSTGVHRELRAGALLVTNAAEVIEAVGELGIDLAPEPYESSTPRDRLDLLSRRVLDAVPTKRGLSVDSIARAAGVAPAEATTALALLELGDFVCFGESGWVLRR